MTDLSDPAFYLPVFLVGAIVSLTIYVLLFPAFLSGVLQTLVAAGTLALAGVTSYITIRDRREALARELADRVYVPMRMRTRAWTDPESPPSITSTWTQLTEEVPYLTKLVPSSLKRLFERGEATERETLIYSAPTSEYIQRFSSEQAAGTSARIHVVGGSEKADVVTRDLEEIYLVNIWKSGKTLEQYARAKIEQAYPLVRHWRLELWADVPVPTGASVMARKIGETQESIDYVSKLFDFLTAKEESVVYRDMYRELSQIGLEATTRVERELRRPVAAQSSSPKV